MPPTSQRTVRVAALVVLVLLLGVALRGRLPGAQPSERAQPADDTAGLLGLLTLVVACLLVMVVSLVAKLRDPQRAKQAARGYLPGGGGGARQRRSWRFLMVVIAAVLALLLVAALFAQLRLPQFDSRSPSQPQPGGPATGSATPAGGPPTAPAPDSGTDGAVLWLLVASFAVLLAVVLVGAIVLRMREHRRDRQPPPTDDDMRRTHVAAGPGSLALAAERGLAEVGDLSREPREAIIACYAAMEHALANAPGAAPQESDTPSEVLARAVEHEAIQPGSATELVALFAEARFSTHVMNESHRESAERALRLVLDELRSPV